MKTALTLLVAGAFNVACFFIGAKVGQASSRGETIVPPTLNPFKAIEERENRKHAQKRQERIDAILHNIESYDGTGANQMDIPMGVDE